jgi:Zn-dependent oligopeptidase
MIPASLVHVKVSGSLTLVELDGLDDSFINELKKDGDKFIVSIQYTELLPVLRMCKVAETRRRLDLANSSRCKENVAKLEEAVKIRHANALLLGYKNHGEFKLEIKMAKTPEIVNAFLLDLKEKLMPLGLKELERLKQLKKKDLEATGKVYDGAFNSWDFGYYNRMLLETEYEVNHEKIKEYFPMDVVTREMLKLYESVLGLKFVEVDKPVWHADVKAYEVRDASSGDFVGTFYLDLFPRDGKYKHAAVFPISPGYVGEDGKRVSPCGGMVANFPKSTGMCYKGFMG